MKFEWDPRKAAANLKSHGVSFEEAASAFADRLSITVPDPEHSVGERRFYLLGMSNRGNLLVVCHTERGENTRIISAWRANARQQEQYEEGT
ncbi:MAG TPA: BrnT family toxin [Thermoanaerobaculia bacterium]|nr:BrnT family toxin [Thermoanaerobaculia bacterium]